ncbi:MAG TPA: sulfite exporter TauE/SafE family protein [Selenomonadales bacterium]|nr:sulfite exporter TauE/SafE family protein [Selenomonadales bacterium]
MLTTLTLFALGFAVGTFGTLVGIGGGIFLVPIFILVMHYSPQNAIGTSLAVVFLNALSGTVAYIRQKKVYYDAGVRFSLATIPGAVAGSYLAGYFTSKTFTIAFGLMLVAVASLMFYRSSAQKRAEPPFDRQHFTYNRPLGVVLSFFIGFLSSILGIGGGVIHVPLLVYVLGFPTHVATATSHFVLAVSTLFGVGSHWALGNILPGPALAIGFGAVLGAQFGARLSLRLQSRLILILLSLSMAALGLRLALS